MPSKVFVAKLHMRQTLLEHKVMTSDILRFTQRDLIHLTLCAWNKRSNFG